MYLGNFTIGQEVALRLHATDSAPQALSPDAAPTVKVFDAAGNRVVSDLSPALDRRRTLGLFGYLLTLGSAFSAGRYLVTWTYSSGGTARTKADCFDVVPGGDAAGGVVSQYHLERPQANHLVQKTDAGKRFFKRGPHL